MATPLTLSNKAPTPKQAQRTREFISLKAKELLNISQLLLSEKERVTASEYAISNLETSLLQMREALGHQREVLEHFEAIQSHTSSIKLLERLLMMPEEDSRQCYEGFKTAMEGYVTRCASTIKEQPDICRNETRNLEDRINEAESELQGWKDTHSLLATSLEHLQSTKARIEKEIESARITLRAILNIPSEIWVGIFQLVIYAEFHTYLEHNSKTPLRSTPHILSHVCRFWHQILRGDKSLWNIAAIHPCETWSQNKYSLLQDRACIREKPLVLVANLSQSLTWFYKGWEEFQNNLGERVPSVKPDAAFLPRESYSLYVDMEDDQEDVAKRLTEIPYRYPHTLILSSRSPLEHGQIFSRLSSYPHLSSLVLLNKSPVRLPTGISDVLRNLTSLQLIFGNFPERLQLSEYLLPNLKELHLRDDSGTSLPSLTVNSQLSHLQTLGINHPARNFFEKVEMNALKTLVLYPFNTLFEASPTSGGHAISTYSRVLHLKFEDWSVTSDRTYCYGAVEAFTRLASKTPALVSVTFDRCHVDGEALVQLVIHSKGKDAIRSLPQLEEITLTHTKGITRDQCEKLKGSVSKLNVYI